MEKTENYDTTALAKAFKHNGFKYTVINYTEETYEMLKHKREVIVSMQKDFEKADIKIWYEMIKSQTDSILVPYDEYQKKNARYIYSFRK